LLLSAMRRGQPEAGEQLIGIVYNELRRRAARFLQGERSGHTLQATALVHEAYLKLVKSRELGIQNRSHFFAIASKMMRQILVDHARKHRAVKRGCPAEILSLDEAIPVPPQRPDLLIVIDEALKRLSRRDPRQADIVERKFFGGLKEEEIAEQLGISVRTVKRDWRLARAWLYKQMTS
jgi:RNA polymerase sigma-70 factor, ECF subfamily